MRKNPNLTFHDLYKTNNDDRFDIISGLLNKNQKRISPKYFYDEVGSSLFDKITNLKDYYPTKKEIEILEDQNEEFFKILPASSSVIEFGSGSNKKIKRFLKALNNPCEYIPIDISRTFLLKNARKSAKDFPKLKVKAICADFDQTHELSKIIDNDKSKIGFFPGSTIGNYIPGDAKKLLKKFSKVLEKDNFLVIGVDLQKNIKLIEKAYNDSTGLTAKFNKNILNGINKICGPTFEENNFSHKAFFNNEKSRIEMHLVSKKKQTINICEKKINFRVGETIHTENSYKYSIESFTKLVESSGYEIIKVLKDKKSFFAIFFLKVKYS
tara:strand:+ start:93 stop:1070 length:978 start_codon:yes stop_codon:yes gene_type:complete